MNEHALRQHRMLQAWDIWRKLVPYFPELREHITILLALLFVLHLLHLHLIMKVFMWEAFLRHFQEVKFSQLTDCYVNARQLYISQLSGPTHQYVITLHLLFLNQSFSIDFTALRYILLLIFSLFLPIHKIDSIFLHDLEPPLS
jgi:hypothetical protein